MSPTKTEKPKTTAQIAKAYFGAIADKDLETASKMWKPGCKAYIHGIAELEAPGGWLEFFRNFFGAFPDLRFEVLELAASGQNAGVRWRATGTFTGPGRFQGLAPTGATITMEGTDMLKIVDGEVVENNAYTNGAQLAQQLGMLPPPGSTADRVITNAFNAKTATAKALRKLRER